MTATDPRFADTVYAVEASNCERHMLWREWHERLKWEEDRSGYFGHVGEFGGMSVTICCNWAQIEGHRVCFYFSPSKVVHHGMVEEWMKQQAPACFSGMYRQANGDAGEFRFCIEAIERLNGKGAP